MKNGDVGMAKCFSKNYRNKGWPFNHLQSEIKVMSRCLSVPDVTSLHLCLLKDRQYFTILSWFQVSSKPCKRGFVRYMPSPFYRASVVLSSFIGAWSVVYNPPRLCIIILGSLTQKQFLAACSWGSDVGM